MRGIVAIGTYVPRHRLDRAVLASALDLPPQRGTRSVASHDEDVTTLAVEAARPALRGLDASVQSVWLASTRVPYLDKTNAAAVAAALRLGDRAAAYDVGGALRSGMAAMRAAASESGPALAVLSDIRYGLPTSDEEMWGGDAAAAVLFGDDPIAEVVGTAALTAEFMDRWRAEGDAGPSKWDERWSAGIHTQLMQDAAGEALKSAGLTVGDVDRVVVASPHRRAASGAARGFEADVHGPDLIATVGYAGTAHVGLALARALEAAAPGEVVLVVTAADGADAVVLRTTDRIEDRSRVTTWDDDGIPVDVARYHTWRGLLRREPPRRPEPTPPASPPSARNANWKFGFEAAECTSCGARHLPPHRVCRDCHAIDQMAPVSLQDTTATVATFTIDHLAWSLSPPTVVAVLDFDGGGRYPCQITDADADSVAIGDRVEMTFRVLDVARNGARNYFWKARPVQVED